MSARLSAHVLRLLEACRVPAWVPEQTRGLWQIERIDAQAFTHLPVSPFLPADLWPDGRHTMLFRHTLETLHRARGECVMEDSIKELSRHLPLLLHARGRVLVSGLGLGCVIRGLLRNPAVTHIDVVEIDAAILGMVAPEFGAARVRFHHGDALTLPWPAGTRWDYAWHDVWSEHDPLDLVHAHLILRYADRCGAQGAWQLRRWCRRLLRRGVPLLEGQAA